jgi:hypothetical protein
MLSCLSTVAGHEARDRPHMVECADNTVGDGSMANENRAYSQDAPSLLLRACRVARDTDLTDGIELPSLVGGCGWSVTGLQHHACSSRHSAKGNSSTGPAPSLVFL